MNERGEEIALRIVWLFVIIGFASSVMLWTTDTSLSSGESLFAVYLSIDLIAFAMVSYIYRVVKMGDQIGRIPLLAGTCVLVMLVAAGLAL